MCRENPTRSAISTVPDFAEISRKLSPPGKTSTIFGEARVARASGEAARRARVKGPRYSRLFALARDSRIEFRACSVVCVLPADFRAEERRLAVYQGGNVF